MLLELINYAKDLLGPLYLPLHRLFFILFPITSPTILNWIFLLSALVIAWWVYLNSEASKTGRSLTGFKQYLFPKSIYLHESAIDDYKFYVVNALFLVQLASWLAAIWGIVAVEEKVRSAMVFLFGQPSGVPVTPYILALYSLVFLVGTDMAKWLAHFLEHKVPILWEFHKVHHSAEVLTPVSNYRVHPVDFMVEQSLIVLVTGLVAGVFSYWVADSLVEFTIFGMSALMALYWLSANLRHSHVPLSYGRFDRVFSSPSLHHIHHSLEPQHHDKNFGLVFSFWDRLAGTLYTPKIGETYRFGITEMEPRPFRGIRSMFFGPFKNAFAILVRKTKVISNNPEY
jgi:sterol desaturase/sphingolipid hydroxylase (fatty acid hydroxylase superfamily)